MNEYILKAQVRKVFGKNNIRGRRGGLIPGILYGHQIKNVPVLVAYKDLQQVYQQAGLNSLVSLTIENREPVQVLIHDLQVDPLKNKILHVDLYRVKMTEKITSKVPLLFMQESPAVREQGGVLLKNTAEVEVESLPADLSHEIKVDISVLKTFDDIIYIKDLKISDKVKILSKPDEVVATVLPPRSEEELKALEEKVEEKEEVAAVETVEKKETEEAETAEAAEEKADEKVPKQEAVKAVKNKTAAKSPK